MPTDRVEVRHRRKKGVYGSARIPLIPGYVFVRNVTDWPALTETRGVIAVLGCDGAPMHIPDATIGEIRAIERLCLLSYHANVAARMTGSVGHRKRLARQFKVGASIKVHDGPFAGKRATVEAVSGRKRIKAIIAELNNVGIVELPVDDIELVA